MRKDLPSIAGELLLFVSILAAPILIACMVSVDLFSHSSRLTVALNGQCCEEIATRKQNGAKLPSGVISIEPNFGAKSVSLVVCNANRESLTYVWNAFDRDALKRFVVTKGKCEHTCLH